MGNEAVEAAVVLMGATDALNGAIGQVSDLLEAWRKAYDRLDLAIAADEAGADDLDWIVGSVVLVHLAGGAITSGRVEGIWRSMDRGPQVMVRPLVPVREMGSLVFAVDPGKIAALTPVEDPADSRDLERLPRKEADR